MIEEAPDNPRPDWPALLAEHLRVNGSFLFKLAFDVLHDRAAAEDACQKVSMIAWTRREEIHPQRLKGWLATAVVNESLAVLRRKKIEHKALKWMATAPPVDSTVVTPHNEGLGEATLRALAKLDDDVRAVVTLRVMHGHTGREVAATLGVSDGQVSKLLHGGMEMLRGFLAEWNEPDR